MCIAHIIIIFRTRHYCLRVSHMHGAPSLMVLTIWMQISEKKTAEGCSAAWQRSVILRVSRAHAADGPDRPAIYANFNDIFRFPNNYYCFSRFSRPRANPMPESYDRPTRGRTRRVMYIYIHTYIHILFYFRPMPSPPQTAIPRFARRARAVS